MNEPAEKPTRKETVIRLLFAILFALIYSVAELVVGAVVVLQFGFRLITGDLNSKLLSFSKYLNHYIWQILQFVTFRQDEKPFPFADWPTDKDLEDSNP